MLGEELLAEDVVVLVGGDELDGGVGWFLLDWRGGLVLDLGFLFGSHTIIILACIYSM